ncbi:uncharacterized protein SCHCODRAFT_02608834 [Schizophyllum commune H4-8]|uniref:uncharacterized protein n=1 Tax=Schizophyllum commune (strain H4-8 / FGSC 9210) TaxID=578458 RepID=UPI0021602817|nr:uncharacterized protein SCHCODRAFT_02608834 [Schizophyllum commune H4-8]KAI5900806.1 hypothetical protein SCHCODRAFT_02608834 [Schizophyllum commune H4-8]
MPSSTIYTSPYPPLPAIPSVNAHHLLLGRPEQATWEDFALYVDPGSRAAEKGAKARTESGSGEDSGRRTKAGSDSGSDNTITFHAFRHRVAVAATVLARQLEEMGLDVRAEPRPIVGILSENSVTFATAVHALLRLAVPFALLPAHATPYELGHSLRLTGAKVVLVGKGSEGRVEQAGVSGVRVLDMECAEGTTSLDGLIDAFLVSSTPTLLPPAPATPSTLAYLVLSSGTSGLPKAVMITHGNLIASLFQVVVVGQAVQAAMSNTQAPTSNTQATLPPSPFYSASSGSDTVTPSVIAPPSKTSPPSATTPPSDTTPPHPTLLAFLPMYHSYALHTHLFRNFLTPTTTVVMRKWDVGRALGLMRRHKITTLTLVPSVVHQLVTLAASASQSSASTTASIRTALAGVSSLMCGAAHLPADLRDRFLRECAPHAVFSEGYGLSEATLSAVGPPPDALSGTTPTPRGSVGKLMPGLRARVVPGEDDKGDNATGELYLAGPTIAPGYYNNKEATRETFVTEDGDGSEETKGERWLRTGDRFYVDRDGWFFFADRAKDTLKVSGAQVSPREIEEVLLAWRGEGVGEGSYDAEAASVRGAGAENALPDAPSSIRVLDAAAAPRGPSTNNHPRVLDAAVAGVRGHGRTADERVPRAWVVLEGASSTAEDRAAIVDARHAAIVDALHAWTRARLSRHKWLRGGIEVVREIPKNPTGKVLRRVLVERYERGMDEGKEIKAKL